jgi:WhiB family transcriptional regulator, redox-sensing transcriptional regulator
MNHITIRTTPIPSDTTGTTPQPRPNEGDGQMSAPTSTPDETIDLTEPLALAPAASTDDETTESAAEDGWWAHARCNDGSGRLSDMFFSEELQDIARAKHICATCPALIPCLEGALERREPWGVWGGQLFLNGRILATKRRRGRPPKLPRPEDQLPEIPIPEHLRDVAMARSA